MERYGSLVWSVAKRLTTNHNDAEDAVQEIFLEIWQKAGKWDPTRSAESTFITMIARRKLIDRFRKSSRSLETTSKEQYQLWIVDPKRDSKPVDGGIFDIKNDGEVLIAIKPKLSISNPTLFAVTIEKPGGVVVADQSSLPLIAKVMR